MGKLGLWVGLALPLAVAVLGACDSGSAGGDKILASYKVTVSSMGRSDLPDELTLGKGSAGSLLLTIGGISTDGDGLRATVGAGGLLRIDPQAVHVDHDGVFVDGTMVGDGKMGKGDISLTLHFSPAAPAAGSAATVDYSVQGSK
jgi:hypothetical protein